MIPTSQVLEPDRPPTLIPACTVFFKNSIALLAQSRRSHSSNESAAAQSSIVIPHGRGGDMSAYLDSMERLLQLDFDLMIPSHGAEMTQPKKIIQAQIHHRLARERKIQAALDAGARDMDELLARSYDDVPQRLWELARRTLKAHLVRLGVGDFDD